MKKTALKAVAAGIGAALFFIIAKFAQIPTGVPNLTISFQFAIITFFGLLYGPYVGGFIGFVGHLLNDATSGWGIWWPWVLASAIFGVIIGIVGNITKVSKGYTKKKLLVVIAAMLVATIASWLFVAPLGDVLIYQEDIGLEYLQGSIAGISNFVVSAVVGNLLVFSYSKTFAKNNSLDNE